MRELLEKLEGVMPRPWALKFMDDLAWMLAGESYDYIIKPGEGDVGLAPLTALLKQELYGSEPHEWPFATRIVCPENDTWLWACWRDEQIMGGDECYFGTEFEAVAHAYLSLRPKEEA